MPKAPFAIATHKAALLLWLLAAAGCGASPPAVPVTEVDDHHARLVQEGLGIPWGMAFVAADRLLVSDRAGSLRLLDLARGTVVEIAGVPRVAAFGQGGLLDVALAPDFAARGWLYLSYAKPHRRGAVVALARARLAEHRLVELEELFVSNHASRDPRHFGGRLAFDGEGHLYLTHGDRGNRGAAQDLGDHAGKVLRLALDGSVPPDNPFLGVAGARPEIWSLGHRNPQGIAFDPATGRLWLVEHGPRGGDELNLVERGGNYGWPGVSYGMEYHAPIPVGEGTERPGMVSPRHWWIPSIAPSSLLVYRGARHPELAGALLVGALAGRHLAELRLDEGGRVVAERRHLGELGERIRSLAVDGEGGIWLGADSGRLYRLERR